MRNKYIGADYTGHLEFNANRNPFVPKLVASTTSASINLWAVDECNLRPSDSRNLTAVLPG
jgi:hypothetical protein